VVGYGWYRWLTHCGVIETLSSNQLATSIGIAAARTPPTPVSCMPSWSRPEHRDGVGLQIGDGAGLALRNFAGTGANCIIQIR
jgi:hypothetical protein